MLPHLQQDWTAKPRDAVKRFSRVSLIFLALHFIIDIEAWEPAAFADDRNVTFPDKNLEAVVREALALSTTDPIPRTKLATLTALDGYSRGIKMCSRGSMVV